MVESGAESAAGNAESRDNTDTEGVKSSEKVIDENEKDVSKEHSDSMTSPRIILSEDEDEDDDVPGDFFDDFLKEDFMAGLDVVDEDEGEEKLHLGVKESAKKNKERKKIEFDDNKRRKRDKRVDLRSRIKGKKRDDDDLRKMLKDKDNARKNIKSKIVNVDEFDIRRDPTKTKRDIERDKARCEKDKEQKIITEKLRLVETGLVPPGMEMETDLEEIKKQNEDADNKERMEKKSQTKDTGPSKNSETKSSKSKDVSSRRRSSSPAKRVAGRRNISPRRRTNRSPRRLSRSPRRLSRSPRRLSRSPKRSRSPRRLSRSPRRRAMSPRGLRRIISPRRSPIRRSPLRSRDRSLRRSLDRERNRSRSREKYRYSPRHRRSHSRSPRRRAEADKKKSFLQELAEKLNETRPSFPALTQPIPQEMYHVGAYSQNIVPTPPIPGPVPAPVPPPPIANQFPPQQHYDRNFFIGTPGAPQVSPNLPLHLQVNIPNGQQLIPPAQIPQTPVLQNNLPNFQQNPPPRVQNDVNTKDGLSRLFQDKKITLTEFLAITAKPEVYSASPDHMKQKINVISRCQEAIKYLANSENKYTGPLVVKKSEKQKSAGQKYKSPLLVSSQLKLPFTEIPKSEKNRSEFTTYINDLLKNLGLGEEEEEEDDVIVIDDNEPTSSQSHAVNSGPPPAPKISYVQPQPKLTNQLKPHQLSKQCQTHQPVCLKCETRDRIRYKNAGTQCGNDGMTFTVGTQVSDDDFYMKIAKTQSLAALTPAQLLARSAAPKTSRSIDADDFDLLFPVKKPVKPPGFAYGEAFGSNRYSPTNPSNRFFEPPGPAGVGRDIEERMRAEANRLNFKNNYY